MLDESILSPLGDREKDESTFERRQQEHHSHSG